MAEKEEKSRERTCSHKTFLSAVLLLKRCVPREETKKKDWKRKSDVALENIFCAR